MIIVGIAIAVGITIFNNQAYNANQQAVSQELNTYGTMIVQWWKTPVAQGGAGQSMVNPLGGNYTAAQIASAIGFNLPDNAIKTDNGEFRVTGITTTSGQEDVTLEGLGTEKRGPNFPWITAVIDLTTGDIETTVGAATAF